MRYLLISVILIGCGSKQINKIELPNNNQPKIDSFAMLTDELNSRVQSVDSIIDISVFNARESKQAYLSLKQENALLRDRLNSEATYKDGKKIWLSGYASSSDNELYALKQENKYLKAELGMYQRQSYRDSLYRSSLAATTIKIPEKKTVKPNEDALIIDFDKGSLTLDGVSVYLIPYSKNVKGLMEYEIYCDMAEVNRLKGKQADYYNGEFFFNDVKPGKYLIKVCCYYGNYKVINRVSGSQVIEMQLAPPVQ